MENNIANYINFWQKKWRGTFNQDLYIAYLIAKQNRNHENEKGIRKNLGK
jgi:hypothetical protein